jgi:hypothetical protein
MKNRFRIADVGAAELPKINETVEKSNFLNITPLIEDLEMEVPDAQSPLLLHRRAFNVIVMPALNRHPIVQQSAIERALSSLYPAAENALARRRKSHLNVRMDWGGADAKLYQLDLDKAHTSSIVVSNPRQFIPNNSSKAVEPFMGLAKAA